MPKLEKKIVIEIIKKALLIWSGLCLLVIGFVSMLFPVVPGFILMIIGLAMIAKGSKRVRKQYHIKRFLHFIKEKLKKEKGMVRRLASFL